MSGKSYFESRTGTLTCSPEVLFKFVTDLRNFEQFVPGEAVSNWNSEKESCSFNVPMLGTVSSRVAGKENNKKVIYEGDAFKENDFSLVLNIKGNSENLSVVNVSLEAELNPILKTMASKPITQFLEKLIDEMESYSKWNDIKE